MATTRPFQLHDNLIEGMDGSLPAHLIGNRWRWQHNFRLTPQLEQIPRKTLYAVLSSAAGEPIRWLGVLSSDTSGDGKLLALTDTRLLDVNSDTAFSVGFLPSAAYSRWAVAAYNRSIFYCNDYNSVRYNNGSSDVAVSNAPAGRYLRVWYDHLVIARPTLSGYTANSRFMISDLYKFSQWTPDTTNEADYYELSEWEQVDNPGNGITGMAPLRGAMWFYTPAAIIPVQYVGKPKIINVMDASIITRNGNTFPYTLAALDQVHFFFDYSSMMFYAFDGSQLTPIGEPIREWLREWLHEDPLIASSMTATVDPDNQEIWWRFVSNAQYDATVTATPQFDKAVVFNYRWRKWYTASAEPIFCNVGRVRLDSNVGGLVGAVSQLEGTVVDLRGAGDRLPRLYGSTSGELLRDEVEDDVDMMLYPYDTPVLETADLHYGDIRTTKENDAMVVNATWPSLINAETKVELKAVGRQYLGTDIEWGAYPTAAFWSLGQPDDMMTYAAVVGRVLRYQFSFPNARLAKMSAWSDSVRLAGAER